MTTIGIDIGGRTHVAARCRDGQARADREILRVSQSRAGFAALDAWLERQPEPVTLGDDGVVGPLLDAARQPPAPARGPGRGGQPARGEVLCQEPAGPDEVRPGRCPEPRRDGHARHARRPRPAGRRRAAPGGPLRDDPGRPSRRRSASACIRLVELGFPELGELFDDPTCRTAREVLRIAPTARAATRRRTATLANANAGPGHRRLGDGEGRAAPGRRGRLDRGARARRRGRLRGRPPARPVRPARAPDRATPTGGSRRSSTARLARRLQTIPGVGPSIAATLIAEIGDIGRFDDFDQLLAYAGRPPGRAELGHARGRTPRPPGT